MVQDRDIVTTEGVLSNGAIFSNLYLTNTNHLNFDILYRLLYLAAPRSLWINTSRSRTALTRKRRAPATVSGPDAGSCDSLRVDAHRITSVLSALS